MNWFVLSLPEPDAGGPPPALAWARVNGAGAIVARGRSVLPEIRTRVGSADRVLALVPGERVLLHLVAIPARARAAQLQALPFALEERLSEDLEALHIVAGPRRPDGRLLAAVAAHRDLEAWLGTLREAGVSAHALLPDTLLLPEAAEGRLRIWCQDERCLLADAGSGERLAVSGDLLPWWLNRWLDEPAAQAGIEWFGPADRLPATVHERTEVRFHHWDGDLLGLVAPALRRRPPANLLTERYAPGGARRALWAQWRVPAGIAAALAVLWTASLWVEVYQLENEARRIDQAIAELFEETLPGTRMVDPPAQFRQALEAGAAAPAGSGPVAERLAAAAPILVAAGGEMRQLRADADRLELELDLASIAALDELRNRLREGLGTGVRILAAESGEEGVRARLQIGGGGS
ncbi:general secretion pathway protein L [Thioalkalivibrio nitratireducens DSM 14787]|uniref:Type II secretion system protein L n=1 Tax=Thioalkalivibrio nitratireducens (strain DSM 14787 / UNIQEM 213 / ALEN2) TaxID=1255043 RepID=L0E0V1_THIND|nr:type II secretion system protein GspL [Thioalkalivibrio nitratireducens]AGA35459.1 general secretion pathway protein L [Thioalkalivibrio nitratireducens DSM 14787]